MKRLQRLALALFLVAFCGCAKRENSLGSYSLIILGELDRSYVSVWLDGQPLAGGFLSSEDATGVAFQMSLSANIGSVIEVQVGKDVDELIKSAVTLTVPQAKYILAAVQKTEIVIETQTEVPAFK